MPTEEEQTNMNVIAEYFAEYWGKGNADIVDKLCADNFVINYPMHGPRYGKEAAKKMLREFKEAFPDISFHAYQHPLIASGPYVVGRWIGGGTHTGVAFHDLAVGALDQPNTGKKMYFSGTTIFTLKDGKIVDETGEEGALTALQQLGLIQGPNAGKEINYLHESNTWQALCNRTPAAHASFIYGVLTTRIFCRPTCPARLARRANVVFFDAADDAVRAGFRPCKRCKPDSATPERRNQEVVQRACGIIRERNGAVTPAEAAKLVGLSYRYFHGVFKEFTGVTPAHFARQCREEQLGDAVGSASVNTPPAATSMHTTAMPKTSNELCMNNSLNQAESGYKEGSSENPELEKDLELIWQEICQDDGHALWGQVDETLNGEVPWNEWLSATYQVNDVGIQDSEWII